MGACGMISELGSLSKESFVPASLIPSYSIEYHRLQTLPLLVQVAAANLILRFKYWFLWKFHKQKKRTKSIVYQTVQSPV